MIPAAARVAALLLRATADALDAFTHTRAANKMRAPDTLPDWVLWEQNP